MMTLYKNTYVYTLASSGKCEFVYGWLLCDGEKIAKTGFGDFADELDGDVEVVDLEGGKLAPGLIDIHSHGRAGGDFNSADKHTMLKMSRSYLESGVTGLMPTLASDTLEGLYRSVGEIAEAKELGAKNFLGVHLEGRYLNPKRRGAHAECLLAPLDADEAEKIVTEMKKIGSAHVSASLELDENGDFTKTVIGCGATLGLAHTDATFREAQMVFDNGAVSLTHTYNAMSPFHHRDGGAVGAGLLNDGVYCELIVDGFHVSPEAVRLAYKMKNDKIVLITDSMEATGMPDGEYSIAGLPVTVKDGKARTHEGAIAGSTLSLLDGVKNLAGFAGITFNEALYNATAAPAKMLGIFDKVGSLEVGKVANMLVLDKENNVREVIFEGEKI
jgi:N-acetylglucosamine-6-phosphate deacetylase